MSTDDTKRIWEKLDVLGRQYERVATLLEGQRTTLDSLSTEVKKMARDGCAKAESHSDHEKRIRSLEISRATATGGMAIVSAVVGFVAGVFGRKMA